MADEVKAAVLAEESAAAAEYLFHLDALPERVSFSRRLEISGWLFHRQGKPIHGLRGVVKPALRSERVYKARRKRTRPAIGAAYPSLPEAEMSGFLLEIEELSAGRCTLELQVRDHEKNWRTIYTTAMTVFPLDFIGQLRLPNLQRVLVERLRDRFAGGSPALKSETGELAEIKERLADLATIAAPVQITTVHLFVTSKSNLFIIEIAQLVCAGFREAGFAAKLYVDGIPAAETPSDTIQIVVTPHEFFNLFLTPRFPAPELKRMTRQLYLLGTEQPDSDWFHSNLMVAPNARAMLDINPLGVEAYRLCGLRCFHLPLGYHPMLERTSGSPAIERDLDVCLLASLTERREKFLARNADFFAERNCHLRLVPLGFAKTEETKSYLAVEERNAVLQRSKLLLNIHYSDFRYFEWHRMLVGLANGCCIVTETCEGFAPLIPGKHFVMVEPGQLVEACRYYLESPAERTAIAGAGRAFIREHLTQADNCLTSVGQIASGRYFSLGKRSDAESVTAEPLPKSLQKSIGHGGARSFRRALRTDLSNFFAAAEPPPLTNMSATEQTKIIESIRERRRGFTERFALQTEAEGGGEEAMRVSDNDAFRDHDAPAISVVITLYNYQGYIRSCVQSVNEASLDAIPGGIEILIVDDASTDQSLRQARRAQRDSVLPVRIIEKRFNTGLADARNVGLRLARAPYAFIMDADNLIFTRALEELYKAITRSGFAAAYSILCRFRGQPNNRSGLLSYFDWDPTMLVEYPYIDAMALFDRQQLLALGGYDNELFKIGWFGWEDYELWLRMAAAHLRATLVPNILCLYRHHESAMSRTTNLFEIDLVRHLIARYQPLIDEYPPKKQIFGVEWARLTNSQPASTNAPSATSF
jgi:glycosyltransferase involved in cell wall biosynthesis